MESEAGLDGGTRLVEPIELRERGSRPKKRQQKISVGLDRPPKPRNRLLAIAELELRSARANHPGVGRNRIARASAQGLDDMSLGFLGATDENLAKSDAGMSVGEISIQRQRMFEFDDALGSALGPYLDIPQ